MDHDWVVGGIQPALDLAPQGDEAPVPQPASPPVPVPPVRGLQPGESVAGATGQPAEHESSVSGSPNVTGSFTDVPDPGARSYDFTPQPDRAQLRPSPGSGQPDEGVGDGGMVAGVEDEE